MTIHTIGYGLVVATCAAAWCACPASAQVASPSGQPNLTQQQLQSLMMMRAMQGGMGMNRVRTGYPQAIPFGNGGFGPTTGMPNTGMMPEEEPETSSRSTSQERIEMRKTREEQQRAAREEAKAKRLERLEAAKAKKLETAKHGDTVKAKKPDAKAKKPTASKKLKKKTDLDEAATEDPAASNPN